MNYSRPVIAGAILSVVALVLVLNSDTGTHPSQGGGDQDSADLRPDGTPGATTAGERSSPRRQRSREASEAPDAKSLKLLWARGRSQELLVALDQLAERADDDDWLQVAEVLVEQAASDGRHEIATYLLATGHGAPDKIRLSIYAAALENPDEGIRSSAKLELLNLTGREFDSRQEADAWIASHPEAVREEGEVAPGD